MMMTSPIKNVTTIFRSMLNQIDGKLVHFCSGTIVYFLLGFFLWLPYNSHQTRALRGRKPKTYKASKTTDPFIPSGCTKKPVELYHRAAYIESIKP